MCLNAVLKGVNQRIKIFAFQGTPAKHETPTKAEEAKPTVSKDKENIYPTFTENRDIEKTCIVNETFEVKSDKYSSIALLDDEQEEEKWEERTAVITKTDHEGYVAAASSILQDVLQDVKTPVKR